MNNGSNNAYKYDYDDAYNYEYGTNPGKYTISEEKLEEKKILLTELKRKKEDKKIKKHIIASIVVIVAISFCEDIALKIFSILSHIFSISKS